MCPPPQAYRSFEVSDAELLRPDRFDESLGKDGRTGAQGVSVDYAGTYEPLWYRDDARNANPENGLPKMQASMKNRTKLPWDYFHLHDPCRPSPRL